MLDVAERVLERTEYEWSSVDVNTGFFAQRHPHDGAFVVVVVLGSTTTAQGMQHGADAKERRLGNAAHVGLAYAPKVRCTRELDL